jgi:hypothetical protein
MAASSRPPEGLGLDWPEHDGTLDRLGLQAAANRHRHGADGDHTRLGKFKLPILGEVHTAGNMLDHSEYMLAVIAARGRSGTWSRYQVRIRRAAKSNPSQVLGSRPRTWRR